jgi:hypothetical protein
MKARNSERESVNEVKQRVSQTALLQRYLGVESLPALICSPLRADRHPSFFIYSPDGNKVLYQDYATGDHGDIFDLLKIRLNLSFAELIHEITRDKQLGNISISTINKRYNKPHTPVDIKVKIRGWEQRDIDYWKSYGISLKWLQYAEVYPISHKIIYKDGQRYAFHAAKLAYAFVERKEDKVSIKVYQPLSKRFKWTSSNNGSVIGLWTKLPQRGNKVVICSSLKDALCLWANTGIPAIYLQSETTTMSATAQSVLKSKFKRIYICFDNDPPGLADARSLSSTTGFHNVILPQFPQGKDISDLYKALGKEEFLKIINPLFNNNAE